MTQYRNKKNFFLLSKIISGFCFNYVSWTFSEAGHGKSPADGVGGLVKRTADQFVCNGNDVINCHTFLEATKDIKTCMFEIKEADARITETMLPLNNSIVSIPHTMSVHEIVWKRENATEFRVRNLTCLICKNDNSICSQFNNVESVWRICTDDENEDEHLKNNQPLTEEQNLTDEEHTNHYQPPTEKIVIDNYVAVVYSDNYFCHAYNKYYV